MLLRCGMVASDPRRASDLWCYANTEREGEKRRGQEGEGGEEKGLGQSDYWVVPGAMGCGARGPACSWEQSVGRTTLEYLATPCYGDATRAGCGG